MEKFIIDLNRLGDSKPIYETSDQNVMLVRARNKSGEINGGNQCLVEISLSRDAMLGLGTELIRSALRPGEKMLEVFPVDRNLASQWLGTYLHPDSCRLIIFLHEEFGTVESLLAENSDK